jgi:hypothetical protein
MAVRKEPPDLRYDVNKDGRITSQDAFLVSTGRATIPTVEQNAASQNTSPQAGTGSTASDPIQNLSKQLAQYINPSSSGGAWSTQSGSTSGAGFGPEGFLKKMAENFYNQTGLTDLNKLGYGKINTPENAPVVRQPIYGDYEYDYYTGTYTPTVTGYQWATPTADFETDQNGFLVSGGYRGLTPEEIKTIKDVGNGRYTANVVVGREGYYNKDTGAPVKFDGTLGGYGEGPGWTNTRLTFEGNRPVITTTAEDTSDLGTILPIISIALLAVPGIGQAIGSAILPTGVSTAAATAVGNAVVNAGLQVAAGAPVEQALTNAAASLGVSQLVPNLSGNSFVDNAVRSVATATLTGGDVGNALANSLIATGGNELLGNTSFTGDKVVDSAIASAITSGVQAAATSGDVGASIIRGGIAGASGQLAKEENVAESARSGAGFTGEDAVDSVAGAIGNDSIPAGVGVDTVGGIAGADTVNAGVAENDVLDLIQRDIDTSVANNVQDVSNVEQEVQPVTPVESGTDAVGSAAQDDVLGVVAQEQADIRAQTASQAMQGAKQITAAEAAARELYPLTERYQGPNGTVYVRDINTGKITQLLPTGEASAITGGGVFLDRPDVIGAVEALPANAVYQGILYANDPRLIGKQLTADDLENLSLSTDRDANVLPVGNLIVRQNADGTVTQFDRVTGDTATIDASGKIVGQTKSLYTRLNDTANAVTGTGQSALGELGASLSATGQQLGLNTQGLIENFQAMQAAGERMRPESINQQSTAFVDEIYQVASRPGVTATEIAKAVVNASKNNPIGAVAVLGSELIQELPALLLPGGNVAKFLGSMALNVGESAGAQALQKIDELKVSNPTATPQELARLARQDSGIAALTTASLSLIPGANNALVRTLTEPFSEALEEGLIEYATSGDINAARGKAVLGAVIGGKTSAAINTGEQLASAAQTKLGVQLPSNTPTASITVTAPRDATGVVSSGGVDLDLNEDIVGELPPTDLTDLINIPINVGSTANNALTISTGDDNVVAGEESNGVVLQNNNDGTSLVLTQDGGSTVVPSVDASTGNQLQPGSTVVVNTDNNTASTAPVTQETGGSTVIQDTGQQASLAQQEAARVAAEQETQRQAELQRQHEAQVAAEQARQAELERQAYEAEQAKLAAEQQAKEAADAAARVAAQEAARLAAEEQTRIAAEQEANRIANEQAEIARQVEAARQAEAARIATEQAEQAKLAAEQAEQARIAEANRIAAEQEAARVAAEQEIAIQEAIRQETARAEAARAEAARVAASQEQERAAAAAEQERLIQTAGTTTGTTTGATTDATTGVTTGSTSGPTTGSGAETSTGVVLQDNGDGTVLVLTSDGNASIVSDVDSSTGGTLTTGSSVVVDNNTGTASSADTGTGTGTGTGVSDTATGATPAVDTYGAVTAGTGVTTGATTGDQVDTGGTQVLPEITTVGGTTSTDSTGTSTLTPGINVELPELPEPPEDIIEDTVVGGGGNDLIVGGGSNDVIAGEPTETTTTEEDLLLEQIIRELETTPPVSEGVPIQEPEFPEPSLVLPESPTIDVADRLTIRPRVERRATRPSVSPGSRVEESAQILPLRPGLSEGGTGGIEGTTEQEQEPVWNVRSLKLRRLLGI